MPLHDVIFRYLEEATSCELKLIAASLGEKEGPTRADTILLLSKALRSTSGNSFANVFRDDHVLPYEEILRDVCAAIGGRLSSSTAIRIPADASIRVMEDFVYEVSIRAQDPLLVDDETRSAALREIEMRVFSLPTPPPVPQPPLGGPAQAAVNRAAQSAVAAAAGAIWSLGAAVLVPFALGTAAAAAIAIAASPTMDKVVPATLLLIHIRKRHEAEAMLAEDTGGEK